jgi:uncharacterized membrane protein YhaH (DUF805 family)
MLNFFFSFQGRLSRCQFLRGYFLMSLAMFPAFVSPLLIPSIPWWIAVIIWITAFSIACASAAAMSTKRAHDLGKSNIWALWPFFPLKLFLGAGQPQDNQYGPARRLPGAAGKAWHIGRWIVGLGLAFIVVFGAVSYRAFTGPSWKWPECKPAVTAEGLSLHTATERWRQFVAGLYGSAYAQSELTVMQSTACSDGVCTFSARPCVQRP